MSSPQTDTLQLPLHTDRQERTIALGRGPVTVMGANGSGKSRFTEALVRSLGERAFSLSALHGIFEGAGSATTSASVRAMYDASTAKEIYREPATELDCLIRLLMQEEITMLMLHKLRGDNKRPRGAIGTGATRLDRLMDSWREIFPGNNILVENGRLLLSRDASASYTPLTLSAGERAVMYYLAGMLLAPEGSVVFVDDPTILLHSTVSTLLWNTAESLRPDCTIVYTTHDLDFAASRTPAATVWVRDFDAGAQQWHYEILRPDDGIPDEVSMAIVGSRRPVLFIEGDGVNSIDAKLYPLIFNEYTVKSLGSCNKVIEATRSFNDLKGLHHLESHGIVDRDRRDSSEVEYLRRRGVFVPEVAEIENILMLEEVIRAVASLRRKDEDAVFAKVKRSVLNQFRSDLRRQALLHTRHRVKRQMEYRVDGRFNSIGELEDHIDHLVREINPRALYEGYCRDFRRWCEEGDYSSVLRVYNQKSMLPASNVAGLCGLRDKQEYLRVILEALKNSTPQGERIRRAVIACFGFNTPLPHDGDEPA